MESSPLPGLWGVIPYGELAPGVPHEGMNEEVIDEHQVPSRQIGRVRGPTVEVYGPTRNSSGRSRVGDALGRGGITRCGLGIPAEAARPFYDHGGPVSGHALSALRLTPGLIAILRINSERRESRVSSPGVGGRKRRAWRRLRRASVMVEQPQGQGTAANPPGASHSDEPARLPSADFSTPLSP